MARTISEGFTQFHKRLTPTGTQSEAEKRHRRSIRQCLINNYGLTQFFQSGSFGNGTSINGYSDVDYFAVLPANQLSRNSTYSLKKIKGTLAYRFPYTGVKIDDPAILCPFGQFGNESTEVVPCYESGSKNGHQIYSISDRSGGWLKTSPSAHNSYVRDHNTRLKSRLKHLIRFIKAWKFYNNVPIASFYLELRVTKLMENETYISFHQDLAIVFEWLKSKSLPYIVDPMGVSGHIHPCSTTRKKEIALSRLNTAAIRSARALEAIEKDKISLAFKK